MNISEEARRIYEAIKKRNPQTKLTLFEIQHLLRFLEEVAAIYPAFDPKSIDLEHIIDSSLSYEENKQLLAEKLVELGVPYQVVSDAFYATESEYEEIEKAWREIEKARKELGIEKIRELERKVKKLQQEKKQLLARLRHLEQLLEEKKKMAAEKAEQEYAGLTARDIAILRRLSTVDLIALYEHPEAYITEQGEPARPSELRNVIKQILQERGYELQRMIEAGIKIPSELRRVLGLKAQARPSVKRELKKALKALEEGLMIGIVPEETVDVAKEVLVEFVNDCLAKAGAVTRVSKEEIAKALELYEAMTNPHRGIITPRLSHPVYFVPPERVRLAYQILKAL